MREKQFSLIAAGLLLFVVLLLSTSVFAKSNDTVRVGMRYDPSTVNIIEMKLGNDLPVILGMHETLITVDPKTGERIPFLAEKLEIMENGKDIRIKLRKGSRFHTGDPVTAHDVKFTYEQCVDPKNANMLAGPIDEIEEIEVLDDYNLIFHFWEPYAAWRELMWVGICSKKYYEKVGREEFRKHPVGSGLFRFVERKIGESVTLELDRNYAQKGYLKERFGQDLPDFKRLQFVTVPDDITRLAMLETGELDLVSGILPHQVKRLKRNKYVKIKSTDQVPSLFGMVCLPRTDPVMSDRYLGMAITHAINRQEIVDKIFLGQGYSMYMYASKSELGYDPNIRFDFNPDKAREYLKKSAYKPGYPLTLTYTSILPNSPLIAAAIQKYLKDVGITVKLQQLEEGTATTYTRNRDKRLGHLRLYSWAGGRDPSMRLLLSVLSTSPYTVATNRPRKDEMDALVKAQSHELDEKKRLAMLKQIHEIMTYDATGIVLFGLNMIYAMSDRIEYTWTPNESFLFNLNTIKVVK